MSRTRPWPVPAPPPVLTRLVAVYENWSLEQAREFLTGQGVQVRSDDTLVTLQKELESHAAAASKVRVANEAGSADRSSGPRTPRAQRRRTLPR